MVVAQASHQARRVWLADASAPGVIDWCLVHGSCSRVVHLDQRKSGCCQQCQTWRDGTLSSANKAFLAKQEAGRLKKNDPSVGVDKRYLQDHHQAARAHALRAKLRNTERRLIRIKDKLVDITDELLELNSHEKDFLHKRPKEAVEKGKGPASGGSGSSGKASLAQLVPPGLMESAARACMVMGWCSMSAKRHR